MTDSPPTLADGDIIAATPYLIGYPPKNGVAILGFNLEGTTNRALLTGSAFVPENRIDMIKGMGDLALDLNRAFKAAPDSSVIYVLSYTDDPVLSHYAESLGAEMRSSHRYHDVRSFVVENDQYYETTPGATPSRHPLPAPSPAVTDHYPTPADSRSELLQHAAPTPTPTYESIAGLELDLFRELPPVPAVKHVLAALDHPDGLHHRADANHAGQVAYLLTRDIATRDLALMDIIITPAPAVTPRRLIGLVELARGCPDTAQRSHLYATAAFASYALGSGTPHTDGLLTQVRTPVPLANTLTLVLNRGLPSSDLGQFLTQRFESTHTRETLINNWRPPRPASGPTPGK